MWSMNVGDINVAIHSIISSIFYEIILVEHQWWWLIGLLGGMSFIVGWALKKSILGIILDILFIMTLFIQPVLYFVIDDISQYLWGESYTIRTTSLYAYGAGFVVAGVVGFMAIRNLVGSLDGLKDVLVKKSSLERIHRTDIRNMKGEVPDIKKTYNPEKYFKPKNKVFIGLNKSNVPQYIAQQVWRSSHIDFIGTTGSGKGIVAGMVLTQAIMQGETVVVLDPKNDEFLPHVLAQAAEKGNVPFYYIDLQGDVEQWNPFAGKTSLEIEELFSAGFGLSEKGTDADFYRLNDRKAARMFANKSIAYNLPLPRAFAEYVSQNGEVLKESPKFVEDLEEIASLPVTHIQQGLNLENAINKGAVIYVRGSMRNPRILKLQKMFVLSVMQACEKRNREHAKHVCLFLDEFKYLISRPAMEALGAIRDKRAHVILAHQSLGDLKDCPKDIDPASVVASINENCSIKLTYKVNDPDTADWLARMSGKILVDDEMRSIKTTKALTEVKNPDRMLRQTERCLIDSNMLQALPARCAVLYGNGLADFVFTSPIKVIKKDDHITPSRFRYNDESSEYDGDKSDSGGGGVSSIAEGLLDVD